ncbi:hypothetical protein BgAZ_201820 [Babesia gibsoni]|uniref:Uncharacterized protein n=1 Tax=Babesia gibsoni TaxID=33632 RepID=A0AAD8LQZ3_BABGI|nr:hypothetical protein BgAZ_201820 [Babesia gibsoni]
MGASLTVPHHGSEEILTNCSLDDILSRSLKYGEEEEASETKDSQNVSLVFNFLKNIWTFLTDSSLYESQKGDTAKGDVIPFMHSDERRREVAHRILDFLSQFREDEKDGTGSTASALTNIAHGHLRTSFNVLSTCLLSRSANEGVVNAGNAVLKFLDVFTLLVPSALDFPTFVDLLTELVKNIPADSIKVFADYVCKRGDFFSENMKHLESSASSAIVVQTCGAKLIWLTRILESNLREIPLDEEFGRVFKLRIMISSCLPASHLGLCNRQSVRAELPTISPVKQEEWNHIVGLSKRRRVQGISQFEITNYEAVATISGFPNSMSGQVFDIKSYTGGRTDSKSEETEALLLPTYTVYRNYCDLLNFIYSPEVIAEKPQDYVDDLSVKFTSVVNYIYSLLEKGPRSDSSLPWVMEPSGNAERFIFMCTKICFWESFLCSLALAIQTLKLSHKWVEPNDSVYSQLKEKTSNAVDSIEKTANHCMSKIVNLTTRVDSMLGREKEWITWKRKGCQLEVAEAVSEDKLTYPGMPITSDDNIGGSEMQDFLYLLEQLEKVSPKGTNGLPEIGSNCRLVVGELRFDRQAETWYLPNAKCKQQLTTAYDKLCHKFDEYAEKLRMDADPANDIEESERSKQDPLFRFRFNRLFANRYCDVYNELSNDDLASGCVERLMNSVESKANQHSKKVRKKKKV